MISIVTLSKPSSNGDARALNLIWIKLPYQEKRYNFVKKNPWIIFALLLVSRRAISTQLLKWLRSLHALAFKLEHQKQVSHLCARNGVSSKRTPWWRAFRILKPIQNYTATLSMALRQRWKMEGFTQKLISLGRLKQEDLAVQILIFNKSLSEVQTLSPLSVASSLQNQVKIGTH